MPIFCFKSNLVLAIDVVTGEVFARVTNCVQKRTIRLSEKLAYFMNLMEARVIFQCKNVFGQNSKIGYVTAITRFISWGVIEQKNCPQPGFDNRAYHVE